MKRLIGFFICLNSTAMASTSGYDLKMDLSLDGKHVSSPSVIVKSGEMASIIQKTDKEEASNFIEVIASEGEIQNHKGILMKFKVGSISKSGERTVLSEPRILAKENELAKITVSNKEGGSEQLSLSVVVKRKNL
jgi:hypothetical protein